MFTKFHRVLCRVGRSQRGSLSVEMVLAVPMLFWAITAIYVFFDAYRAQYESFRANYTISDMLSRQTDAIDVNYLNGLDKVFRFMTGADRSGSWVRISVVRCTSDCTVEDDRILQWDWSHGSNGARDLTAADMPRLAQQIPLLAQGDRLIVVETAMHYEPLFAKALRSFPSRDVVSLVVTRPRFAPQLLWDDNVAPVNDGGAHDDLMPSGDV